MRGSHPRLNVNVWVWVWVWVGLGGIFFRERVLSRECVFDKIGFWWNQRKVRPDLKREIILQISLRTPEQKPRRLIFCISRLGSLARACYSSGMRTAHAMRFNACPIYRLLALRNHSLFVGE